MRLKSYLKVTTTLIFTSLIIWSVSHADVPAFIKGGSQVKTENYSAIGTVSAISASSVSLSGATDSDGNAGLDLSFDLGAVDKIQSTDYTVLSVSDINPGDNIVVQGLEDNGATTINRIIDFSWGASLATTSIATSTVATSTASTTDATASSTDSSSIASSTDQTSTSTDATASSTLDVTASTTDVTASSTESAATSTDQTSTSTDATASTTVEVTASTTSDIASSTDSTPPPADTGSDASTTNP